MLRPWLWLVCLAPLAQSACRASEAATPPSTTAATPAAGATPADDPPAASDAPPPAASTHPWAFSSRESLLARHPTPAGFTRAEVGPASFGEFLRSLPVAPEDEAVRDYRGAPLFGTGHHDNIASVVDIDVGARDLQQCADAVLRMHAEWHYGRGDRNLRYHAASGLPLSYARWLAGERVVVRDGKTALAATAAPRKDTHASLRAWLDDVFTWANTGLLAREGLQVPFADVQPGDFFVLPGSPFGHAVLVLDVAKAESGKTALLLGQSYMPAQSFQVLRPSRDSSWFVVEPGARDVATPFWIPFPMSSLRRLK